jgi:ubiquinone biosynthesis protein COQ9
VGSSRLLQLALPLVRTHGFTREALARSVLDLPAPETHAQPLSETAVSALFGSGDVARKKLINAWLNDGINQMKANPTGSTMKDILGSRLKLNEPVLQHLPEVMV